MHLDKPPSVRTKYTIFTIQRPMYQARPPTSSPVRQAPKWGHQGTCPHSRTSLPRSKQEEFNRIHNITPKSVQRNIEEELKIESSGLSRLYEKGAKGKKIPKSERDSIIKELSAKMHQAAKMLEFEEAARLRDEIARIRSM